MMKLDNFINMMTGHFNNKEQFDKMQAEGKTYPYAEHVNTICNDKIKNLPEDFNGRVSLIAQCFASPLCHPSSVSTLYLFAVTVLGKDWLTYIWPGKIILE